MSFQRRCTLYITLTGAPFSSTASSEQCTMVDSRADSSSPPNVERYSGEFCTRELKKVSSSYMPRGSVGEGGAAKQGQHARGKAGAVGQP